MSEDYKPIRAAFIACIKHKQRDSEPWAKSSFARDWRGPEYGFRDTMVNEWYWHFKAGYLAALDSHPTPEAPK